MATRTARRGFGTRAVIAGGVLLALSASFMSANADTAPVVSSSSVATGWSGSDRLITVLFDQPLSYNTNNTKTTVTLVGTNADATARTMPISSIAESNGLLSVSVASQPHPDDVNLGAVYMWERWSPYTLTINAVPKAVATPNSTATLKFKVDGAPPAITLNSPSDMLPNFFGLRDGPLVVAGDTYYTDAGAGVYVAGEPIPVSAYFIDRGDKVNAAGDVKGPFSSGLKTVQFMLTDVLTRQRTALKVWGNATDGAWKNPGCTDTLCTGKLDLLDHTGDDNPGPDNSIDIAEYVPPGVYSLQIIATDLSGLRAYTKPFNIIRLG